jgi:hypothetical protein
VRPLLRLSAGFALLAVGAVLLIPLPELGLPAAIAGLRLLGRRYSWARAVNTCLDETVRAVRRRWSSLSRPIRLAAMVLLVVAVLRLGYLTLT